ncbi:MAG: hypothetical protein SCARUB_01265 [Candidatus Scalindua rubra]|uniref:DUF763 domain-containing protein n=1 Tax=Candidatus Scalindua rubra TaxID=1872076 RepID=A0A1E3XD88_9BACT|nr:MAG: hypothetical protein SCARUB_01265 [Candidatus Scalindua rubra]
MKVGTADLPLHYGKAPSWLFQRMKKLAREIAIVITSEFGPEEFLRKISDPFWFQALGCALGFDWHSSGVTTTVCGALKEGVKGLENELGIFIAGGKGGASRKTPSEIEGFCNSISRNPEDLVYSSKMSAKVDSSAVQDGYQLYHHCFYFTKEGFWTVVQQGMNETNRFARRYHWLGEKVNDFVIEPHSAICCDKKEKTLNMVAIDSEDSRKTSTLLTQEKPESLIKHIKKFQTLKLPTHHPVLPEDLNPKHLYKIFTKLCDRAPENFERLIGIRGVGPKTVRALSLISELIYGHKPSFEDPARYSFAHGGKDGHPYPVDKKNYDTSIEILRNAISQAKMGNREKMEAIKRLG